MEKKNILTYEGLRKYEDELQELKVVRRKEVSQKLKEARAQGDLSENAEYDAAKDEQRDIETRIEEIEKHADWVEEFLPSYTEVNADTIDGILQKEIGQVFCRVLSDAGVFKRDDAGKAAFRRFVTSLS